MAIRSASSASHCSRYLTGVVPVGIHIRSSQPTSSRKSCANTPRAVADEGDLLVRLGHVRGHFEAFAQGIRRQRPEQGTRHRVGSVGRQPHGDERAGQIPQLPRCACATNASVWSILVSFMPKASTNAYARRPERIDRVHGGLAVEDGVTDAGDAGSHALHRPQEGGGGVVGRVELPLGHQETHHPITEIAVVEQSPERGVLQVHVGVHETRAAGWRGGSW